MRINIHSANSFAAFGARQGNAQAISARGLVALVQSHALPRFYARQERPSVIGALPSGDDWSDDDGLADASVPCGKRTRQTRTATCLGLPGRLISRLEQLAISRIKRLVACLPAAPAMGPMGPAMVAVG